jgi:hypothetical protein
LDPTTVGVIVNSTSEAAISSAGWVLQEDCLPVDHVPTVFNTKSL